MLPTSFNHDRGFKLQPFNGAKYLPLGGLDSLCRGQTFGPQLVRCKYPEIDAHLER